MTRGTRRGFTLMEMMVVLLIASVLSTLAWTAMNRQRPRQRLSGFTVELRALLHGARQTALTSGRPVVAMVFPNQVTALGTGRIVIYSDGDGDFFADAGVVDFAAFDASAPAASPNSEGLEVLDLPNPVTVGPATGQGAAAVMPAPFNNIPINVSCSFCTGANGRGAIVFDPGGVVRFQAANGPPLAVAAGGSLSLTAADAPEVRTLVIAAASGALQTISWNPAP